LEDLSEALLDFSDRQIKVEFSTIVEILEVQYTAVSSSNEINMRRDPIFYQMFQRSPVLLFDLIGDRPTNAADYRFDSVAV
jgi:Protein of unknown function (DUF2887)